MLTCSMMRYLSLLLFDLCGMWSHPWSVCEVVSVPYVDVVTCDAYTAVCVACEYGESVR